MDISKNKQKSKGVAHQSMETYNQIKALLGVPLDEPIFIIRAQDKFSTPIIKSYRNFARDGVKNRLEEFTEWYNEIGSIINDFMNWQRENKDKVKVPD